MDDKADTNLADVYVGTVRVDLRVIQVKDGGVDFEVGDDLVTGVARRNDQSFPAVLARVAKAEGGSWHEVCTGWVDGGINRGELIANLWVCVNEGR